MVCRHVLRMNPFPRRISMKSKESLDPARVGFLRPRGVVLGQVCFMHLMDELHGCSMVCEDSNVNIGE